MGISTHGYFVVLDVSGAVPPTFRLYEGDVAELGLKYDEEGDFLNTDEYEVLFSAVRAWIDANEIMLQDCLRDVSSSWEQMKEIPVQIGRKQIWLGRPVCIRPFGRNKPVVITHVEPSEMRAKRYKVKGFDVASLDSWQSTIAEGDLIED